MKTSSTRTLELKTVLTKVSHRRFILGDTSCGVDHILTDMTHNKVKADSKEQLFFSFRTGHPYWSLFFPSPGVCFTCDRDVLFSIEEWKSLNPRHFPLAYLFVPAPAPKVYES